MAKNPMQRHLIATFNYKGSHDYPVKRVIRVSNLNKDFLYGVDVDGIFKQYKMEKVIALYIEHETRTASLADQLRQLAQKIEEEGL